METPKILTTIEDSWQQYSRYVEAVAEVLFHTYVVPFCKQSGYTFLSGNGTFFLFIDRKDGTYSLDTNDEGEAVTLKGYGQVAKHEPSSTETVLMHILNAEVPGMDANCLGSLMPNYTRKDAHESRRED